MNKRRIETILIILLIIISLVYFVIDFSILPVVVLVVSCVLLKFSYPIEIDKNKDDVVKINIKNKSEENKASDTEPDDEEVSEINYPKDLDEKTFLKDVFLLYKNIQTYFMNFEYDNLMNCLGVDLYNQYSKQMKGLQDKGKQAVRVNINLDKIQTESYVQDKDCDKAVINIAISEDKYMKDIEEALRLTSSRVRYESCYRITIAKRHKKKIVRKCYNCGEKVQSNPQKCPLCESMLLESADNWIMVDLKLLCSHSKKES